MTSVTVCRPAVWSTNRDMASRRERLRNPVYVRDRDRRPTWRTRRPSLVAQHPSAARICRTASRRPRRSRPGSETWPHGTSDTWHTARRRVQHRATLRSCAVAKSCESWLGRTSGIDDLESDRLLTDSKSRCGPRMRVSADSAFSHRANEGTRTVHTGLLMFAASRA